MGVMNQLLVVLLHVMLLSTYAYVHMTRTTGMTRSIWARVLRAVVSREGEELCTLLPEALLVEGPVAAGYGRGSKKLGVPTANLPHFSEQLEASAFANGVYFGWAHVRGDTSVYPVVANIGLSPMFVGHENAVAIVEAHLLGREDGKSEGSGADVDTYTDAGADADVVADVNAAPQQQQAALFSDFYHRPLAVALVGYLRPERKFEGGLDALVAQIHRDLSSGRALAALADQDAGSAVAAARRAVAPFLDTRIGPRTAALDAVTTTTTTFRVPVAAGGGGGGTDSACTYSTMVID